MKSKSKYQKNRRLKFRSMGVCYNHPKKHVVLGKTKCQECLDTEKERRDDLLKRKRCPGHSDLPVAVGKTWCQRCLDRAAIDHLPKNIQPAAWKRADETRESRIRGTYRCPILGKTEEELKKLFLTNSNRSVWSFDHVGEIFRDIISQRANHAIGVLTSEQLFQGANYVKKYE